MSAPNDNKSRRRRPSFFDERVSAMRAALDSPDTSAEAYNELVDAFYQFLDAAGATATHPKLIRLIYALALEEMHDFCDHNPRDPRAEYLRGLHAELVDAIERAAEGEAAADADGPDWPEVIAA